jgi:hypothetical protein
MTTREATDSEMLDAVERWARVTKRLASQSAHGLTGDWIFAPVYVLPSGSNGEVKAVAIYTGDGDRFDVNFHTALLVALLIEGGTTVDVGRCPTCEGSERETRSVTSRVERGTPRGAAHHRHKRIKDGWRADGWRWAEGTDVTFERPLEGVSDVYTYKMSRPCSACTDKPGRDIREAARLVLDAVWRTSDGLVKPAKYGRAKCHGCGYGIATTRAGFIRSHTGPGPGPRCSGSKQRPDTAARDSLHVKADDIQRTGDPLGEWLSLWLAGSRERTDDMTLRLMEVAWRAEIMHGGEPSRGVA